MRADDERRSRSAVSEFQPLTMADIMAEFYDGPHATPPESAEGAVYLGIKNITDEGRLDLSSVRWISEDDLPRWTKRVTPRAGDIVFTYEATLHRYALIPDGFHGCLGRRLALIRPDRTKVDSRFLHLYMLGPVWRSTIEERTIAGSTVDRIPIIDFPKFPIDLPALDVQRSIAAVLGAFDEAIEVNQRRIELLQNLARSLYREWFVRFRFPGHENAKFVDSELGLIPEGWTVRSFSDVAHFVNGFAFKPEHWGESGRPIIKIRELKNGVTGSTPRYDGEIKEKFLIEPGDLLFSWSADLGVYLWSDEPGLLNQHLFKVEPEQSMSVPYLLHALDAAMPQFDSRALGTTMRHIKRSALTEVKCIEPTIEIIREFDSAVGPLDRQVLALRAATRRLAATRDLLLPRLVTGKLDISEIDLGVLAPSEAA